MSIKRISAGYDDEAGLTAMRAAAVIRRLQHLAVLWVAVGTTFAQTHSWNNPAAKWNSVLTGPIATGLALVAIVAGGLQLALSKGGTPRAIGGLAFALGLALAAIQFDAWLLF